MGRRVGSWVIGLLLAGCGEEVPTLEASIAEAEAQGVEPGPVLNRLIAPQDGDLDAILERRYLRVLVAPSRTFYFLDGGRQRGISYELGQQLEAEINERLGDPTPAFHVVFVPVRQDLVLDWLREGRGDVAAGNLTVTPERKEAGLAFTLPFGDQVSELVVTGPGAPTLERLEDLAGQRVYVTEASSYVASLEALNERLPPLRQVEVVEVDPHLTTEDILELVAAGTFPITVADSHVANLWERVLPDLDVREDLVLRAGSRIAWAVREEDDQLKALLDRFVASRTVGTPPMEDLLTEYFRNVTWVKNNRRTDDVERYDALAPVFWRYAADARLDPHMLAAQGYQESGLRQEARSPVGAVGVMQLMPGTAAEPQVDEPDYATDPEANIRGGTEYLQWLLDTYFEDLEEEDPLTRTAFALASYNAGPGRIVRARDEAERLGLDPDAWFYNVELVVADRIGAEPVEYVARIFKYYVAYRLLDQERRHQREVIEAIQEQRGGTPVERPAPSPLDAVPPAAPEEGADEAGAGSDEPAGAAAGP